MTDWDLLTPGIGLSSLGIVTVGVSLSGIAKTFIEGMHAVGLLTLFIGMIFLASGLFKDGFPSSGKAKSATFITLGFLVTFGLVAAITVSTQAPSIFISAVIGGSSFYVFGLVIPKVSPDVSQETNGTKPVSNMSNINSITMNEPARALFLSFFPTS